MSNDPFELNATIRKLERGRDLGLLLAFAAVGVYSFLYGDELEPHLRLLLSIATGGAVALLLEVRNARIDTLRASLRIVLLARDPSILDDPDY